MGMFGFLKKKKEAEPEEEFAKPEGPEGLEPPAFETPGAVPPAEPAPYGAGVTEPSFPGEPMPARPAAPRAFEQAPPQQNEHQLILAKLETIKAQLDFLQQKFERLEQQLKKEDTIRWR